MSPEESWLAWLPLVLMAALGLAAVLGAGLRWQGAGAAQRWLLVLGLVALGAAAYSTAARLFGIGRARAIWMLAALPLAWWGGRGYGAASVLLVGMGLALAAIAGLVSEIVYRAYRAWLVRRQST